MKEESKSYIVLRPQVPVGSKHSLLASDALRILPLSGLQNRTIRAAAAAAAAAAALPNCLSLRVRVILLRVTGQAPALAWWADQKKSNVFWCSECLF